MIETTNPNADATTQLDAIREALVAGDRLTPIDALRRFGCFRLGARVFDLREAGLDIRTELVEVSPGKRVARYYLAGQMLLPVLRGIS